MEWQAFWQSVSSVAIFVLLAVPGFIFTRKKILTSQQVDGLSSVLVNFLWPVMVIDAMVSVERSAELLHRVGQTVLWTVIGLILSAVVGYLALKLGKIPTVPGDILLFGAVFANTGLIGMPLIRLLLGEEALFLASFVELVNDVLIFTVGVWLIQAGCGQKREKTIGGLLSPGFIAVILGMLLFLLRIPLPEILRTALSMISAATAPLVLFLVGAQLGESNLRAMVQDKYAWALLALRLLLIPAAMLGLWRLIMGPLTDTGRVLILLTAMPVASCSALFTRQYHGDWKLATHCVMLTTLTAVATIPLWLLATIL